MFLGDRFQLELHWKRAKYNKDGVCFFEGAYFSGPALQEALKLNDNDYILLDFFSQYIKLVKGVYVGKFSWEVVEYKSDGTILLNSAKLIHDSELNNVPKLKDNDYFIIDTKGHEVEDHPYNITYKTYVVNEDTQLYNFKG